MSSQDYQAQAQASSFSYTSSHTSSSTSTNGATTSGQRTAQQSYTDAAGGVTSESLSQSYGEPVVQEIRRFGPDGRELPSSGGEGEAGGRRSIEGTAGTGNNRVEDVTETEEDRTYRESMEEEYAKREGGA